MCVFLQQTCLLKEDQRCRSLEDLHTVETESKEMREIVRINSIRKTKSVDDILREQLEEVKDVMHKNIIKIRDREGKLDDLLDRGNVLTGSVSICLLVVSLLLVFTSMDKSERVDNHFIKVVRVYSRKALNTAEHTEFFTIPKPKL